MTEGSNNNGNSTPSPAAQKGNEVPENFYTKKIKPIQGKLITAGVILILSAYSVVTLVKSFKRDDTFKEMTRQLELLEKERIREHNTRKLLEDQLAESKSYIKALHQRDSLIVLRIEKIDANIAKIKSSYNEKFKAIDRFNSAQLLEYYRNLPSPNDY